MQEIINMLRGWVAICLLVVAFLGIPLLILILFIVNLYKFIKKNKSNKTNPGMFTDKELKKAKVELIIFGILSVGVIFYVVNLINILNRPIAFM